MASKWEMGYLHAPDEVFNAEKWRREIDQLLAHENLSDADKQAVVGGNVRRFNRLESDRL